MYEHPGSMENLAADSCNAAVQCGSELSPVQLEQWLVGLPLVRRRLKRGQYAFRAGQPRNALHLIHSGLFKTRVISVDGREKVTGFRLRGDLLGMDSLDLGHYTCDAMALDVGELWELPQPYLRERLPEFQERLTCMLASEIRRDWSWMLAVGSLNAEQRVTAFLLDLSERLDALGFSSTRMLLRMTRADMGNFLSLRLATVVRALYRLQTRNLIRIDRREICILDLPRLRAQIGSPA